MLRSILFVMLLGSGVLLTGTTTHSKANPWIGRWKLNVRKSELTIPAPELLKIDIVQVDKGRLGCTIMKVWADGIREYALYQGSPDGSGEIDIPRCNRSDLMCRISGIQEHFYRMYDLSQGKPPRANEIRRVYYEWRSPSEVAVRSIEQDGEEENLNIELARDGQSFTMKLHVKSWQGARSAILVFDSWPDETDTPTEIPVHS